MEKYIVITGATSGIGKAAAFEFAKKNKNLILVARRSSLLETMQDEIVNKYKVKVQIFSVDLSNFEAIEKFFTELKDFNVETLINNAGFGLRGKLWETDMEKLMSMINLNIKAVAALSKNFVDSYRNIEGTQLINVSSLGGYNIVGEMVPYSATKFFISAFTEGLAHELKSSNAKLKAKILAPAVTKTHFDEVARNTTDFDYDKSFGKYHTAKEMAEFLVQLYESDKVLGIVNDETMSFELKDPLFPSFGF